MKWSVSTAVQGLESSVCYIRYDRAGEIRRSNMIAKSTRQSGAGTKAAVLNGNILLVKLNKTDLTHCCKNFAWLTGLLQ